jgi:hypothetical protein
VGQFIPATAVGSRFWEENLEGASNTMRNAFHEGLVAACRHPMHIPAVPNPLFRSDPVFQNILDSVLAYLGVMYLPMLGLIGGTISAYVFEFAINLVVMVPVIWFLSKDAPKHGKRFGVWVALCLPGFSNCLSLLLPMGIYCLRTKRWIIGIVLLVLFPVIANYWSSWLIGWIMLGAA